DQHALTGVGVRDPLHGGQHPGEMLFTRLAVMVLRTGEARGDLGTSEPRPGADVDLPQPNLGDHVYTVRRGEDFSGLVRPSEVARVDRVERRRGQPPRQLSRL